jgi:hypothetical protein
LSSDPRSRALRAPVARPARLRRRLDPAPPSGSRGGSGSAPTALNASDTSSHAPA